MFTEYSLCARHYPKNSTCMNSFNLYEIIIETEIIIISILQMRKLELRVINKQLVSSEGRISFQKVLFQT